jgi:hypothetical protein
MNYLKAAGLAVIVAAALTTLLGAGTASATVLCKTSIDPCPEGWRLKAGTEIHSTMTVGTSTRETEGEDKLIHNTCIESTLGALQENEGGATETVTLHIAVSEARCTVVGANLYPTELEIHQIPGTNDGTFTGVGEVIRSGTCAYIATQVGTLTGGKEPTLDVEVVLKRTKGFICPTPVGWDATYTITGPTPLYVTEG